MITARQSVQLGTYTHAGGPGLGTGWIATATGRPTIETWTGAVQEPSWLTAAPDGRTLYAVSELTPAGSVSALRLSGDGTPTLLNTVATGAKPAHVTVHPDGRYLFTSLYDGGGVAVHPIGPDGSVGEVSDLRLHTADTPVDGPSAAVQAHAHQVVIDPSGRDVLAVDLGTDTVYVYRLDPATGRLDESGRTRLAVGSGPRHLAFHPGGGHAYIANELNSTVTVCEWADGVLTPGEIHAALPAGSGAGANYPGEIVVAPDWRFVYVSNRGSNTIAVFAVEGADCARLTLLAAPSCGGDWPRHLAIDRTGRWLYVANERSGDVVWFPLDPATGLPGPAAGRLPVPAVTQFHLG